MLDDLDAAVAEATAPQPMPDAQRPAAQAETPRHVGLVGLGGLTAAAAAALAACGGGGGGGGGFGAIGAAGTGTGTGAGTSTGTGAGAGSLTPLETTPTAMGWQYTEAKTDAEAARFLLQAQFDASEADIAAVRSQGYLKWLGTQFDAAPTQTGWDYVASKGYNAVDEDSMVWSQLMASKDGMRMRLALVFSEIFVVSMNEGHSNWPVYMFAQYWDTLVAGVTTTFRKLLEDVTLNPAMGYYLNTKGNQKENAQGRQPDENYAREVMQLMTIGLQQLNPDGSVKTDGAGKPLPTYAQNDVSNLARVFTGYDLDIQASEKNAFTPPGQTYTIETNAWTRRPMALTASRHSTLAATFLGTTVPTGTEGKAALKTALDTLANHPNTGPFIGKQLIQRLVTSNPSPAYVKRVADVFADNGAGVRGDMKSVLAAVLMDNEARAPDGLAAPAFGRLREPMLRFIQWGRTFGIGSAKGDWKIGNRSSADYGLGQSPLRSPSVFNFFRPGYVPPSTALAAQGKVAPEFQLVNETTVGGYVNFMQNVLPNGFDSKDVVASYAKEKALVLDPQALVDRLALLLTANQLSAANKALIVDALKNPAVTAASTDAVKLNRICAAVLMVMCAPEYLIQK